MKKRKTDTVDDTEQEKDSVSEDASDEPSEMMLEVEEDNSAEPTEDSAEASAEASANEEATAALEKALEEARDQLMRSRAEFDNYRKRMARDYERMRQLAAENLIKDLLPVADNFERALEHAEGDTTSVLEGIGMVYKQFIDVLGRHGVQPIPAVGEVFDPNVHEALSRMPSEDHEEDRVAQEYQKGYRIGDTILRPSKVVISSGAPAAEE